MHALDPRSDNTVIIDDQPLSAVAALASSDGEASAEARERHPHGTRARYGLGCRCELCRRANAAYTRERVAAGGGDWYVEREGPEPTSTPTDEYGFRTCSFCEQPRPLKGFRQHESFCARNNPRPDLAFVVVNRKTGERSERIHRLQVDANVECERRNAVIKEPRSNELIDATRGREKIQRLMAEGVTINAIADATNIPVATLRGICIGRYRSTNRRYLEALLAPFESQAESITQMRKALAAQRTAASHPRAGERTIVTLPISGFRLTRRAADAAVLFYRFNGTGIGTRPISIADVAVGELIEAGHLIKIGERRATKYELRLDPNDLEAYVAEREMGLSPVAPTAAQPPREVGIGTNAGSGRSPEDAALEHVILSPDELRYVRVHAHDYLAFATTSAQRAYDTRRQTQVTLDAVYARANEILAAETIRPLTVADATQRALAELQGPTFRDLLEERWKPVMFALFGVVDDESTT